MAESDLMIEEYLEGRMSRDQKTAFESRMKTDEELRRQVESITKSIDLIQKVFPRVDPKDDFDKKVSGQIISITQSNPELILGRKNAGGKLTADDPDAKLFADPVRVQEHRRLVLIGLLMAVLFLGALALILWLLFG